MKVSWSPHDPDVFLTYSHNVINLYKTKESGGEPAPKGSLPLSESHRAVCLTTLSDVNSTKFVSWYPGQTTGYVVAVGQDATGRIIIRDFSPHGENDLVGKEFIPKHPRHCMYLKWNPVHHNLLAQGLEKQRNDFCISIWDMNMRSSSEFLGERQRYSSNISEHAVIKPLVELGLGETTSSFAWFKREPKTFITGIGGKALKVYDTRDLSKPHLIVHTKDVHGVCTDPLHDSRVAAYSETHTSIWDVRNFDKPILTIPADRHVINIDWCPTRSGFLAILCASSTVVKLYDIRHSVIGSDELEPVTFERNILPIKQQQVSHFDWHPTNENRIMTVTPTGQLKDNQIHDRLPITVTSVSHLAMELSEKSAEQVFRDVEFPCSNCQTQAFSFADKNTFLSHFKWPTWTSYTAANLEMSLSSSDSACWMFGRKVQLCQLGRDIDMASRMRNRVLQGYGLHRDELWNNAVVVADEPHLHALWHWLDLSRKFIYTEDGMRKVNKASKFIGVLDLMYGELERNEGASDRQTVIWQYPEGTKSNSYNFYQHTMFQYKSDARSKALQLCGWWHETEDSDAESSLTLLLDSLVINNQEYERAAAIALFNLKLGKCLEILGTAHAQEESPILTTCAMALSGFTEEKNALWKRTCGSLRHNLQNPYLRAMFAFLSVEKDNFDDVLKDDMITMMAIKDRVAFACLYLNDIKLVTFLKDLGKQSKLTGNLDGILVTGLNNEEGLQVLSRYVDVTNDIQTAALALVYSAPSELLKDELAITWIENYRELLDRWKLWHQRAKFDIIKHSFDQIRTQSEAYVSCNFCGKSVACNMTLASRMRPSSYNSLPPTNKPKITCCPGCRKPLPRCALCQTNLGTPSGSALYQQKEKSDFTGKLSPFDSWFSWCQSCRHGGHSSHLQDWFREHTECPVTGCSCKCLTTDPNSQLPADEAATWT